MTAHHAPGETPATGSRHVNVGKTERLASIAGASLLLFSGFGQLRRHPFRALVKTIAGGYLLYRGTAGHCPLYEAMGKSTAASQPAPLLIKETFTVNCPRADVYAYWRKLDHLPLFMKHLSGVSIINHRLSHWEMKLPRPVRMVQWDAEIITDHPNRLLRWRAVPGSDIDTTGEILFADAPGHRGTEVYVCIYYRLPAGMFGKAAGKLFYSVFELQVRQDLHRFKQMIETGETATIEGQPAAREKEAMYLNP